MIQREATNWVTEGSVGTKALIRPASAPLHSQPITHFKRTHAIPTGLYHYITTVHTKSKQCCHNRASARARLRHVRFNNAHQQNAVRSGTAHSVWRYLVKSYSMVYTK